MRLNVKKVTIVVGVLLFLWLMITYGSVIEVPRSASTRNPAVEIENRIIRLQKQMDDQLADSKQLLEKVKKLKKKENFKEENYVMKGEAEENAKDLEVLQKETSLITSFTDHPQEKPVTYEYSSRMYLLLHAHKAVNEPSLLVTLKDAAQTILPVLVIACDRVTVKRCLDNLVKFRPSKEIFPIIVSQDCGHNATYEVIKSYTVSDPTISVVRQPDLTEIVLPRVKVKFRGYYKIARHYKFALNHVFETLGHEAVIIVEDDLDISPDFFEYFLGTYPLLLKDSTLWCISAWNDNGKVGVIDMSRPELLHRTDFFPGLGWVLRKDTWTKLAPKWPVAFFDDWLRNPVNIDGKACIRPEVSRTYSFGKIGVSKGLFFDMHLRNIQLNMEYVEFTKLNLTYLLKDHYDENLLATVETLPEMTPEEIFSSEDSHRAVRVMYSNAKTYQRAAKKLGLMDDFRSGVPRTAYRGIVSCYVRGRRVYLAPDFEWTKYNPTWG